MLLLVADTHFSKKPDDSYRFELFKWIREKQKKYKIRAVLFLGDLTVDKDLHPSSLVNRVVDGLCLLEQPVFVLMGNHDYIDEKVPFFKFINEIPGVYYITEPGVIKIDRTKVLMLPHVKSEADWEKAVSDAGRVDYCMIHQAVAGAMSESGAILEGFDTKVLRKLKAKRIFAGDIHAPQKVGPVEYVGAPYHVHFGDGFKPRVLLLDEATGETKSLRPPAPEKRMIRIRGVEEFPTDLKPGDHIKVEMELTRAELVDWSTYRQQILDLAEKAGVRVFGVDLKKKKEKKRVRLESSKKLAVASDTDAFTSFCKHEKVPQHIRDIGKEILEYGGGK